MTSVTAISRPTRPVTATASTPGDIIFAAVYIDQGI